MKIISKYKDYYDYLMGIYGVDEKIVLDRTEFDTWSFSEGVTTFFIAGKRIDGYYREADARWFFGEELVKLEPQKKKYSRWYYRYRSKYTGPKNDLRVVHIKTANSDRLVPTYPDLREDETKTNEKHNCAIMCTSGIANDYLKYPKLLLTGIVKILPPQDIYLMLCAWLAPKDVTADNRTDKEKIISAGFDTKTSFRKM
jgi:hypothetical protein